MREYATFLVLTSILILVLCGNVAATDPTVIPSYADSNLTVSNDAGARFNTSGNNSYNFFNSSSQSATQGQNALHITLSNASTAGNVTFSTAQSGTFYFSDTGGRGWDDNGILMLAINGTIPDNFWIHITSSGYQWSPVLYNEYPNPKNLIYISGAVNETFTKNDFLYGPQIWKPSPAANNPIFAGQDTSNTENKFTIMFIDLWTGLIGPSTLGTAPYSGINLIDNGMIKIDYTIYNLPEGSLATFNAYAYCQSSKQGEGVRWTNRVTDSGYHVTGLNTPPTADFSSSVTSGTVPLTIQFTDKSTGTKPLTYAWDFNNDGVIDSTEQNPTYTFTSSGTYTVKLTVNNTAGSNEKTIIITTSTADITAPLPSADLPSGSYNTDKVVNLSATDDWDTNPHIYYTVDGTDPTTSSTLYTGPISINCEGITTLKFIAVDATGNISNPVIKTYTIDKTAPTAAADPVGGTYNIVKTVTLTSTDANPTTIYYTTDGSDPRSSSTRNIYSCSIKINKTTNLGFAAVDTAGNWSPYYAETYNMIDINAPLPSADLPSGSYNTDKAVKLSVVDELDPFPKIYYTLDGTNPTINSTAYMWPITINLVGTTILKFIAIDNAEHVSDVFTRIYMLDKPGASGTWNSSIQDINSMYNSIAVDILGNPHIAYYQKAGSGTDYPKLKYTYMDQAGWHTETLESTPAGSGFYVSLALDSLNYPHIAYSQSTPDKLKYIYKDVSGWHFFDLANNTDISHVNLVLYQNKPQISYYENTQERIKYAYYNGTAWSFEDVTPTATGGHWNSLALNPSGNPRISYYDIYNGSNIGSLRYAKRTPTGIWQIAVVDDSANVGTWNSLALDSSGNPRISYNVNDVNGGALKYAYWDNIQWIIETVDSLKSLSSKLGLDPSGSPRVIYHDVVSNNLKYAYKDGSNWIISNIDTIGGTGTWMSLALNPLGVPYASYMSANSDLKYAHLLPFTVNANPSGGSYQLVQKINLTSTPRTTIYYTTDNSDPRISSTKIRYTTPFTVNNTTTLKFAAVDSASNWSSVYTETYMITDNNAPTVTADPIEGTYNTNKSVTLTTTDDNPTTTYYTTDGSDPRSSNTRKIYTAPISINTTTQLLFAAVDAVGNWSPIHTETYTILTITANSAGGNYYNPQNIVLAASIPSEIYYTLDGADPTKSSAKYSGIINISTSKTLKFKAWDIAGNESLIYMEKYLIYTSQPYSYTVSVPYQQARYKGWYHAPYTVKVKAGRYKVGKRWKYVYKYVTKYKKKRGWIYYWLYRNEARWDNRWVLT